MKKLLAIFFALLLIAVPCCIGVSAAGAINADEQKILDTLDQYIQLGTTKYHIPDEYIAQAKNHFLTIDITKDQADEIIGYINEGTEILKHDATPNEEFHMEVLPSAHKEELLALGQAACEVVDLTLTYDVDDTHVVITDNSGNTPVDVFDSKPIIKTTGAEVSAIVVTAAALAVVMVAAFVISKKVKLF